MRLTVRSDELRRALDVLKLTSSHIGNYVRISARPASIAAESGDEDLYLTQRITAERHVDGSAVVDLTNLYAIAAAARGTDLCLETDEASLRVTSEQMRYELALRSDLNVIEITPEGAPLATCTCNLLQYAVTQTEHCVDKQAYSGRAIGGVCFEIDDNELSLVATDTIRLAVRSIPIWAVNGAGTQFVLPLRLARALRAISGNAPSTRFDVYDKVVAVQAGQTLAVCRRMTGVFPAWRRIANEEKPAAATVIFSASQVAKAAQRILQLYRERGDEPALTMIHCENDVMVLTAATPLGEAREEIQASLAGQPFQVMVSAQILRSALRVSPTDDVMLRYLGPNKQLTLVNAAEMNGRYTVVFMPIAS